MCFLFLVDKCFNRQPASPASSFTPRGGFARLRAKNLGNGSNSIDSRIWMQNATVGEGRSSSRSSMGSRSNISSGDTSKPQITNLTTNPQTIKPE